MEKGRWLLVLTLAGSIHLHCVNRSNSFRDLRKETPKTSTLGAILFMTTVVNKPGFCGGMHTAVPRTQKKTNVEERRRDEGVTRSATVLLNRSVLVVLGEN